MAVRYPQPLGYAYCWELITNSVRANTMSVYSGDHPSAFTHPLFGGHTSIYILVNSLFLSVPEDPFALSVFPIIPAADLLVISPAHLARPCPLRHKVISD